MKALLVLLMAISFYDQHFCTVQGPLAFGLQWDSCTHWRIYKETNFQRVFNVPVDSLINMQHRDLNDDSIRNFLKGLDKLEGVNPVWMGCYLASCEDKTGKTHKVVLGQYGGILYVEEDKSYYEVREGERMNWHAYLSRAHMALNTE